MKIIHYQPHLLAMESGSANAARGWCEALVRHGVEVVALVDGAAAHMPAPDGVEAIGLEHSLRGPLRVPHGVGRWITGADAVVVHGGWLLCNLVLGWVGARREVPFVVTTHGVYVHEVLQRRVLVKRIWATMLERPHLKRAAAVHVFFQEEAEGLQLMGIRTPTIVAPNGITYPAGMGWDGGTGGYLLWLGRFDPATKGLDLLVRAIERIPASQRPEVRLHGPDWRGQKDFVRHLIGELKVERWVTIGDPIYGEEKWDLMSRARGCIYPSRWDACPVAVAEAAALGVPLLVARYPLGNFLASNEAAIQADPDVSSISRGILRLMSREGSVVAKNAKPLARSRLSWDAVAESWIQQLESLLGTRSGEPGQNE